MTEQTETGTNVFRLGMATASCAEQVRENETRKQFAHQVKDSFSHSSAWRTSLCCRHSQTRTYTVSSNI
jgi:hypothetical protein